MEKEKLDLFKEMYVKSSKEDILKIFNEYSWRTLQNIGYKNKIKRKSIGKRNGKIENLFNKTLESFYWLGLIVTDGYISKTGELKIDLSYKDKLYLEKLSWFLETKINYYPPYKGSKPNSNGICRVKIKDIEMGIKLRNMLKIEDKKTYNPISIDFIETDEQLISFLGGYIDGDGNISKKGLINIDAHENYYEFFNMLGSKLKTKNLIEKYYVFKYEKMCRISFDVKSSHMIKNKLFSFNLPIMERKWSRIENHTPKINKLKENSNTIETLRKQGKTLKEICEVINYKSEGNLSCFIKNNLVTL